MNEVDDRVIKLDVTKLDKTTAAEMVKDVSFNEAAGSFIITYLNGATITLDTKLEKLAVNFSWNEERQQLVIILDDGTEQYVDLSALITVYEFLDSETIAFSVDDAGKVTAIVKEGSIEEKHLQPNYLADIKVESAKAEAGAQEATTSALIAESYVHGDTGARENESTDNALYFYEQIKDVAKGLNGLIPMGTITFAELSNEDNQVDKYMFNISDDFTTDDTFKEGAGHEYPAGVNVYRTSDGYWDCLAGNFVAGVKGAKELTYHEGFVTLTPENIGALPEDGDSAENTVTYTSGDAVNSEDNPLAWTDVAVLESGEKHSSILAKISTMFKNVRYLFKMLGDVDISTIGDGTVTGAISSQNETFTKQITDLNTDLGKLIIKSNIVNKTSNHGYIKDCVTSVVCKGDIAFFHFEGEIEGTIDLLFSDFGLPNTLKTPTGIYGDVSSGHYKTVATTHSETGKYLYVRAFSDSTSVQLRAETADFYAVTFAVVFG